MTVLEKGIDHLEDSALLGGGQLFDLLEPHNEAPLTESSGRARVTRPLPPMLRCASRVRLPRDLSDAIARALRRYGYAMTRETGSYMPHDAAGGRASCHDPRSREPPHRHAREHSRGRRRRPRARACRTRDRALRHVSRTRCEVAHTHVGSQSCKA